MKFRICLRAFGTATLLSTAGVWLEVRAETVWLDDLDLSHVHQGYGQPQKSRSVTQQPLSIAGKPFARGLGTHARSTLWVLTGGAQTVSASVGINDTAGGPGTVSFEILGDGKKLFDSGLIRTGMVKQVQVQVSGAERLLLLVKDGGDGIDFDHAVWADATFEVTGPVPRAIEGPMVSAIPLTPTPGPAPRINGATIYGCRPGNPFLYRIPTQGQRPMRFTAKGLPVGLELDKDAGIIRGQAPVRGIHRVELKASNPHGHSTRLFRIVSGDALALTPTLGWNHWYAHYTRITDKMVREAADILISSGMADVGYDYVDIDDCWMNAPKTEDAMRVGPLRDQGGRIIPNRHFPDMKGLADYIHAKGLKAGLYSSPGRLTCGGFAGSYGYEAIDAATFAEWGFDLLKYDWCSYGRIADGAEPNPTGAPTFKEKGAGSLEVLTYPYKLMGDLLKQQKRDIVLNLCQYGMANVWEWGRSVGGHSWRTGGDLGFELNRIFEVALANADHRAWSTPGGWNDPDYIQIGFIGNAHQGGLPAPCPVPPHEQYSYMSLWALMSSPIIYSGDMTRLDPFTLNVLCNPEVIDIDQDALGQSAAVAVINSEAFLMAKDLEDGTKAVGLFNRSEFPMKLTLPWAVAGFRGPQLLRNTWTQTDLGIFETDTTWDIPGRGCLLLRTKAVESRAKPK